MFGYCLESKAKCFPRSPFVLLLVKMQNLLFQGLNFDTKQKKDKIEF